MNKEKLLEIKNLSVSFNTYGRSIKAVNQLNIDIYKGETLALIGESGCGKSVTAFSVLQLIPTPPGKIESGNIIYTGKDLLKLSKQELHSIRGKEISIIFQDPLTALNPVFTIGEQLSDVIMTHEKITKKSYATGCRIVKSCSNSVCRKKNS